MTNKADSTAMADYKQRILAKIKALTPEKVQAASHEEISEMCAVARTELYETDKTAFNVFTLILIEGGAANKDPTLH